MDVETAPKRLLSLPSWLIGQIALKAQKLGAVRFAAVGASRSQYAVLSALDEYGPASQIELGRRCGFDRSDMVALLNELQTEALVERQPDEGDRRRNVVTITAAGRRRLGKLAAVAETVQDELLAPLSPSERTHLTSLLRRILEPPS